MEAELRMKMQYDSRNLSSRQRPYINVLPNYPYEAYKQFDPQTLAQIRKTQRVPLPQVRELILLYIIQEKQRSGMEESQLLRQKLRQRGLQHEYNGLQLVSERLLKEEQRLGRLQDVFLEYFQSRNQLISRSVRKGMHNIQDAAEKFKKEVKVIEDDKNVKIKSFMTRIGKDKVRPGQGGSQNSQLSPHQKQELKQIENEANVKILDIIRSQNEVNQKYETNQQTRLKGLRYLGAYLNEFEKAIIFILGVKHVSSLSQHNSLPNENYYQTFSQKLNVYSAKVRKMKDEVLNYIFDWGMSLKHNGPFELKGAEYEHHHDVLTKEMEHELYYFLPNILVNIEKDREQMRSINDFFTKNYENYLGTYYSIKEVQMYHSKQTHIEEVIQNERNKLNSHLKKNFGMMVPYKKSTDYQQIAAIAINSDKPYLKTIMEQKINFLEQAIAYINYEHSNLYKQACSGSPGINNKIKRKLDEFQSLNSRCPQIKIHLEHSCQQLLEVANH